MIGKKEKNAPRYIYSINKFEVYNFALLVAQE